MLIAQGKNGEPASMRRIALATCLVFLLGFHGVLAQSVVFVSPSDKGLLTMSCAEGSLNSFEQLHYLAAAHYLAEHLCQQPQIEGAVGVWKGHAENSGMIDGCPNERARQLGALLAKYYHQEQALVFDRDPTGKTSMITFRATQALGVIAVMMAQAQISAATVIPHGQDNQVMIVAADAAQRAQAMALYASLHGRGLHEETGTTELIGDSDRARARAIFTTIVANAPADVRQLNSDMYSEQFNDLGIPVTPGR
jgi:hypothetical protein